MRGPALRAWRMRLGLTQVEAGRVLGLAVTSDGSECATVRQYESERRPIPEPIALLSRYVERFGRLPEGDDDGR